MPSQSETKYQLLREQEISDDRGASVEPIIYRTKSRSLLWRWILPFCVVLGYVATLGIGFFAGRSSVPTTRYGLLLPPGTVTEVWEHNKTFSGPPTPESEEAWSSVVPVGRGFIHHEELAPFISNIAVFHQMHCLHGIRVAYYTMLRRLDIANGTTEEDPFLDELGARTDLVHMRHCFDYLRHALMCAADTNLEAVSPDKRITTGWGTERICRDYNAVMEWAVEWRNSSETGIL